MLTVKGVMRARRGVIRAGKGTMRAGIGYNMDKKDSFPLHLLSNIEIIKYFNYESELMVFFQRKFT